MEIVEILSALRHCTSDLGCDTCPMRAGIEQRAFCVATLLKESKTTITDLLAGIDASKRRCAQAQAERDALLPYAKEYGCETCKNEKACFVQTREGVTVSCVKCPVPDTCPCSQCKDCGKWEWRGLPETPEEGEKA